MVVHHRLRRDLVVAVLFGQTVHSLPVGFARPGVGIDGATLVLIGVFQGSIPIPGRED